MSRKRFLPLIILVVVWQCVCSLGVIPAFKLPSPQVIVQGFLDLVTVGMPPGRMLHEHTLWSLYRVFLGFAVASMVGIPMGIAMGRWERMRESLQPIVELIRPVPPLAWIPIAILWFGIGNESSVFIIFLGAFFPILLNTSAGVMAIDKVLLEAAYTFNASERQLFTKVLIPGALPSIFTGMRIGMGIGWMTLVAAEFVGVKEGLGLGYMIMTARDVQRPDEIVAGMLVIGLIGFMINALLLMLESTLVRWK